MADLPCTGCTMNELISNLIKMRTSNGMSQLDLASKLNISVRTIQEWEQGRRTPSGAALTLVRIITEHPEYMNDI